MDLYLATPYIAHESLLYSLPTSTLKALLMWVRLEI